MAPGSELFASGSGCRVLGFYGVGVEGFRGFRVLGCGV